MTNSGVNPKCCLRHLFYEYSYATAVMPSSTTNSAAAEAVALMEEAIDAVFALRKSAREADDRARQQQEETKVRDDGL